jgi:Short C-terminal domain
MRVRGRGEDTRLDQLERLGRMRDSGLLDAGEYEREKGRLMAEPPAA